MLNRRKSVLSCSLLVSMLMLVLALGSRVFAFGFAVDYSVQGLMVFEKAYGYFLHTLDGRVIGLEMDDEKGAEFRSRWVKIAGKAVSSIDVERLRVKRIEECPEPEGGEVSEFIGADYQKPPQMVSEQSGIFQIRNVRWDIRQDPATTTVKPVHGWTSATVDTNQVDEVYLAIYPMVPECVLAHAMMVFKFRPGGFVDERGRESQAITLSIEAALPPGQMYDLGKTMKKTFNIVWNLIRWENYAQQQITLNAKKNPRLILYPFVLSPAQKKQLLREALQQACRNRGGEYYNLTRNNCTQNLVVLLDTVIDQKIHQWWIPNSLYNLNATMPLNLVKSLMKRGLILDATAEISRERFSEKIPEGGHRQ